VDTPRAASDRSPAEINDHLRADYPARQIIKSIDAYSMRVIPIRGQPECLTG
jgi:hypothetical protein